MEPNADRLRAFEHERRHLLALGFRILRSDADAQDVVQEAWIRYARGEIDEVNNVSAWLTTVVTRLCLDLLRRRHEYPQEPAGLSEPSGGVDSPEDVALLAGELTDAFTIVLERLTPPQRVALILHDVFGTPFDEIARILDTTPSSAKKLASRARGRLRRPMSTVDVDQATARRVVSDFLRAAQAGDTDGLVAVLHPAVTRTADPHVLPPGAAQELRGVQAVVSEARTFRANARRARLVAIDGRPGIAVGSGQHLVVALVFAISGDRVVHYDVVADPQRLAVLRIDDHT